ncbi:uncharacterized protein LOC105636374 isoform X2 [Jatropha curcas]|uniref:uncharacterized protein LOC105636374 isoform X2 n=1 Tax=Jatropha curcas TaxID=180498 RepID=UPI0009D6DFA9|nr:uncharacterized protein LOC105636374 isoform X2 [Jatropha curcas]
MGKEQHSSPVPDRNHSNTSAGCMWGVLHILKYHHWRHIKKRLPHKRVVNGKNSVDGKSVDDVNLLKEDGISKQESSRNDSSKVDEKIIQTSATTSSATKGSIKSRLKSLISQELYRKKGKHQNLSCTFRSNAVRKDEKNPPAAAASAAPAAPAAAAPINNDCVVAATDLNDKSPKVAEKSETISPMRLQDPSVEKLSEKKGCEDYENQLKPKLQSEDRVNQLAENDQSLLAESKDQELVHVKEVNMDASNHKSKEISDALDMINLNEEFLMKILQDPGSLWAHHFQNQQALSSKGGYSMSRLFSCRNSNSGLRKFSQKQENVEADAEKSKSKQYTRSNSMPSIAAECRIEKILKQNQAKLEATDNSSPGSMRNEKNPAAIKRFKDLKHKLQYAIRQSKNDKCRILKDAICHKIPHGQSERLPKDFRSQSWKKENFSVNESDNCIFPTRQIQRSSSLIGSLDKYSQLYESTFNREAKHTCESSKLTTEDAPKSFRRMFSSPNLKSDFCYGQDSSSSFSSNRVKSDVQQSSDSETNSVNEVQLETTTISNSDQSAKLSLVNDDLGKLVVMDRAFPDYQDTAVPSPSFIELIEPSLFLVPDSKFQQDTVTPASFSISEEEDLKPKISPPLLDKVESLEDGVAEAETKISPPSPDKVDTLEDRVAEAEIISKFTPTVPEVELKIEFPRKLLEFQVGEKEKAEFDYVKDILDLSGFTGRELLGTWHASNQPVDPGLFEELEEDCMLLDPECSGNKEGYHCNHLLLFDLINEVLMEIYAKSYTYCPMPLSVLSHIRPMPIGYHVLEEVWALISWYLSSSSDSDHLLNYAVSRDLGKSDGWMNLQFDSECVGLELEDLIFDELLDELVYDDLAFYT